MQTVSARRGVAWLVAVVMCAMCLAFTGCGGSSGSSSQNDANFEGVWKLVSYTDDGVTQDISSLERHGYKCELTLAVDKTASLNLFGDFLRGSWESRSASEVRVDLDDLGALATLESGRLTIAEGDDKLTFEKTAKAPSTAPTSAAAAGAAAGSQSSGGSSATSTSTTAPSTEPATGNAQVGSVIVDDEETVTITVIEKGKDYADWPGYKLSIKNNSSEKLTITDAYESTSVNGLMADPLFIVTVAPGETVEDWMTWDPDDGIASASQLVNVEGVISASNEDYDTVGSWAFALDTDSSVTAASMPSGATVLVDNDVVQIAFVEKGLDYADWPGYKLWIQNKTDVPIYFTDKYDVTVDGEESDPLAICTVAPHKAALEYVITWDPDDGYTSVSQIHDVKGSFEIWNDETYETLSAFELALP